MDVLQLRPCSQQQALGCRFPLSSYVVYKTSRQLHIARAATKGRAKTTDTKVNREAIGRTAAGNATKPPSAAATAAVAGLDTAYLAIAGLSTSLGLASTLIPEALWSLLLGDGAVSAADPVFLAATRLCTEAYGSFFWTLVPAASYRLAVAAKQGDLSSLTSQRLNLFLGLYVGGAAAVLAKGIVLQDFTMTPGVAVEAASGTLTAATAPAAAVLLLLAASTPYWAGYAAGSGSTDLGQLAAGLGKGLKLTLKTGGKGWVRPFYNLFFWEAIVGGTASLASPINPVFADQALASAGTGAISKDLLGLGVLLFASFTWLLLDALDTHQLGLPTFRALNAACGVVALPLFAVTGMIDASGIQGQPANEAVGYVAAALAAPGYLYLAVRAPKVVEQASRK